MAFGPHTWTLLQDLQWQLFNEVQVNGTSPWSPFASVDQVKYGNNPNGQVLSAIYIGEPPKDIQPQYPFQCWIVPESETVKWRSNPHVYDELYVYIVSLALYTSDYYAATQKQIAVRDATHPVLMKHAEAVNAPVVAAAKEGAPSGSRPGGFFLREFQGGVWYCWGVTRWYRQQWDVAGNIQP